MRVTAPVANNPGMLPDLDETIQINGREGECCGYDNHPTFFSEVVVSSLTANVYTSTNSETNVYRSTNSETNRWNSYQHRMDNEIYRDYP